METIIDRTLILEYHSHLQYGWLLCERCSFRQPTESGGLPTCIHSVPRLGEAAPAGCKASIEQQNESLERLTHFQIWWELSGSTKSLLVRIIMADELKATTVHKPAPTVENTFPSFKIMNRLVETVQRSFMQMHTDHIPRNAVQAFSMPSTSLSSSKLPPPTSTAIASGLKSFTYSKNFHNTSSLAHISMIGHSILL